MSEGQSSMKWGQGAKECWWDGGQGEGVCSSLVGARKGLTDEWTTGQENRERKGASCVAMLGENTHKERQ